MKKFSLLFALNFLVLSSAQARLVQIIHTNDLHSYFVGMKDGRGGYAKLKTKIGELRSAAQAEGIEVLQVDAGDFGEGTSFFLTDKGSASFKALSMLGTEIAVIGNHDHMLGSQILGDQIRRAQVPTKFLSANIQATPVMKLEEAVTPFSDIKKNGIAIRVVGLSTAEPHFQYPLLPGFIVPPIPAGNYQADLARQEGKELIIALTHIGQKADINLAKESSNFDLIIGGHSHTRMDEVMFVANKLGKQVPIVQTGSHGLAVGSLLIDLQDDGQVKVVSYKLHDIVVETPQEAEMESFVQAAVENRNQYFGGRWDEVIGESKIPLTGYVDGNNPSQSSCWGEHMAKMTQQAGAADIGVHLANFEGAAVAPGPLTLGDLVDNFPHFRNYDDYGWEIATFQVNGKILKIILRALVNLKDNFGVNFYGFKYNAIHINANIPYIGNSYWAFGLKVNGKKIKKKQLYTVAIPAEVAYAVKSLLPKGAQKVFPGLKFTKQYYWTVMEQYVRVNSPVGCL